jgi:hypothetical protein
MTSRVTTPKPPEPAAVLAQLPAFLLVAAGAAGAFQGDRRQAALAVLGGEQAGEMLTEDFRRLVAGDEPGPGVPAGHQAVGIDRVDGIVGDRRDQAFEAIVARQGLRLSDRQCHSLPRLPHSPGRSSVRW